LIALRDTTSRASALSVRRVRRNGELDLDRSGRPIEGRLVGDVEDEIQFGRAFLFRLGSPHRPPGKARS